MPLEHMFDSTRILGIDPGLTRTGFGVLTHSQGKSRVEAAGTLTTSSEQDLSERLAFLADEVADVLNIWSPDEVAIERLFLKGNARTAVPAIMASGVCLMAAGAAGLPTFEYTPAQVKQAVVGVGSAGKDQVAFMVKRLATAEPGVTADTADAADAIAVAVCHLHSRTARRLEREGIT